MMSFWFTLLTKACIDSNTFIIYACTKYKYMYDQSDNEHN